MRVMRLITLQRIVKEFACFLNIKQTCILLITGILVVLLFTTTVFAESNSLTIPWWTVDGGGAMRSSGGNFTVSGTAGQHDASVILHRGGPYTLHGGFWYGQTSARHTVYLPLIFG